MGALYVFYLARAPHKCDVKTNKQCTAEEQRRLVYLETKSKEELELLLEMETAERELAREQLVENLLYIQSETERLQEQIKNLDILYNSQLQNYDEKMNYINMEYKGYLTRQLLLVQDRIASVPSLPET